MAGLYTDKDKTALVIRLRPEDEEASTKFPAKGVDWNVFINNKKLDEDEIDIRFGRISTDGDYILAIPYPNESIYSIFISTSFTIDVMDQQKIDYDKIDFDSSLGKALSNYNANAATAEELTANISGVDVGGFRVTLNPALDEAAYKPVVVEGTFIKDGELNLDMVAEKIFIGYAKQDIQLSIDRLNAEREQLEKKVKDYNDRIDVNPKDTAAIAEKNTIEERLTEISEAISSASVELTSIQNLKLDESILKDFQTKAKVYQEGD